jgi:phosphoserine phosphatase RsbU/P
MTDAPTILVVDDSPLNLELVSGVLDAEGFRTLTARNGREAHRLARAGQPDLILLDVMMPDESGFETCAQMKSDPATADIPVIFLSALDDVESKVTGLKMGGVDYITKPMHGEEVLARVRVHLRIRETNRALVEAQRARMHELLDAQRAMLVLPEDLPQANFAVHYQQLEEPGGQCYDVVPAAGGNFVYFVAEITGNGPKASYLTSALKALLRQYAGPMFSPEDTMRGVDSVMARMLDADQCLTACYARLNRQAHRLSVISAGHPPLILVTQAGVAQSVELDSDPLGIFGGAILQRTDLKVVRGDRFFLYSKGLIEEGVRSLVDACVRDRSLPLAESVHAIVEAVRGARGEGNLTLLAAEVSE